MGGLTEAYCQVTRWPLDSGRVVWNATVVRLSVIVNLHGEDDGSGSLDSYEVAWAQRTGHFGHVAGLLDGQVVTTEKEAGELAGELIVKHLRFARTDGILQIHEKQLGGVYQ